MTNEEILIAEVLGTLKATPTWAPILEAMEKARKDERTKMAAKLKQKAIAQLKALREGRPEWWL